MTEDLQTRRRTMQAVRSRNTQPEIAIQRTVTDLGFMYRLHRKDLPGTPDLAFIGKRKAMFVHGCFWHGHDCTRGARKPRSKLPTGSRRSSAIAYGMHETRVGLST